jgi:hypothetical protein
MQLTQTPLPELLEYFPVENSHQEGMADKVEAVDMVDTVLANKQA